MRLSVPWRSDDTSVAKAKAAPVEQSSRALGPVLSRLESLSRGSVLDLGAPTTTNFLAYQERGARIAVADLYRFYAPTRPEEESEEPPRFEPHLPGSVESFDVVLAWDVLNYLTKDEIGSLMSALSMRCSPGALVLALMAGGSRIAASPQRYRIAGSETLKVERETDRTIEAPAYSEQTLVRLLPRFNVESRFQLRNSMVEYLFTYR